VPSARVAYAHLDRVRDGPAAGHLGLADSLMDIDGSRLSAIAPLPPAPGFKVTTTVGALRRWRGGLCDSRRSVSPDRRRIIDETVPLR
jgi:hypothetical protein